jgi:hypothetical protein
MMYQSSSIRKMLVGFCLACMLSLCGCNSADDIHHPSPEKMTRIVQSAVDEPVSLVRVDENKNNNTTSYFYNLDDRGITFRVQSAISAFNMDGTVFGNYYQETTIQYEEDIIESQTDRYERSRIAAELGIVEEDLGYGLAIIHLKNYADIEKLADFAVALDQLYAFKEKKPDQIHHLDLGAVVFSDPDTSIAGPIFSTNSRDRLTQKQVVQQMAAAYIAQLKHFNLVDASIPAEVWNKAN